MLTVVVAVVVAAVPVIAQDKGDRSSRDEGPERVAILPFGNISGVPDDDWIGAGIAEALSVEFQDRSAFDVIGRGRVSETMRIVGVLDTRPAESGMLLEVGRRVGARWVVSGGYQRLGDQLRITGRLVDVTTGAVVRAAKVDGAIDDLFELQDRLATGLVNGQASDAAHAAGRSAPLSNADVTVGAESASSAPSIRLLAPTPSLSNADATVGAESVSSAPPTRLPAPTPTPPPPPNRLVGGTDPGDSSGSSSTVRTTGVPVARAWRVGGAPVIDGEVLNDPVWADVTGATAFFQNTPDEGQPASEHTEVRIVFTDDTLYFGVVCYVRNPSTIIVADSRRDSSLTETDSFRIILDTYLDRQNGFVFGTNPAGIEYDGQVTNEGQGSGRMGGGRLRPGGSQQQRGSGGGFNLNWDAAWQVRSRISDIGWTAEFAIPFRTIRYPSGEVQAWGVNFQRNIRYRNEESFWAPLPRQFNLNRLSFAGELRGIAVPPQRNLKLTPYVLGSSLRRTVDRTTTSTGDVGADLKYSITPSLTLDMTYNTDFAQVEVDEEQINLDRFRLFFPEKRPFFLENAGLFSVGQAGAIEIFFSRRIGIRENGEQIPILGGGRLSGKVGNNTNIGFLTMQTESVSASGIPSQNFTVARVRQDFANRSNVGAIVVNRQATGTLAGDRDYNRTFAVDGRFGIGQGGIISGFAAETETPGSAHRGTHAYGLSAGHDSERARMGLGYSEVGPNFNPEVGFYQRRGFRRMYARVFTFFRPENFMGLHELRPHVMHNTIWNFVTGRHETQFTHIDNHWEWENGHEVHTGVNLTKEGVFEAFEIFPDVVVPPGTYGHVEAQLTAETNQGAPVSVNLNTNFGGFFGGQRVRLSPAVSIRVGEAFNAQLRWDWNDIELPGGAFVTNLGSLRASYSFTPRMFVQALVQYNDRADLWSSNIRFGLISDANTGLFVVYNDIQELGSARTGSAGRTLTLKYSHLFDLLN